MEVSTCVKVTALYFFALRAFSISDFATAVPNSAIIESTLAP